MKQNKWLRELPFLILFLLPWIVLLALGDSLPDKIPSHYSPTANGWVVDSYMAPVAFVAVLSIVMIILYIPLTISGKFYYYKLALIAFLVTINIWTLVAPGTMDSNFCFVVVMLIINGFIYSCFKMAKQKSLSEKYYNIVWISTHFITTLPMLLVIFSAQNWVINRIMPQAVFLFLTILGNLSPNIRPNYFIGIRTPWTLMSEDVWRTTHRVCSKWLFAAGLTGFVLSIFLPLSWLRPMMMTIILSFAAFSTIFSYIVYKRQNPHLP